MTWRASARQPRPPSSRTWRSGPGRRARRFPGPGSPRASRGPTRRGDPQRRYSLPPIHQRHRGNRGSSHRGRCRRCRCPTCTCSPSWPNSTWVSWLSLEAWPSRRTSNTASATRPTSTCQHRSSWSSTSQHDLSAARVPAASSHSLIKLSTERARKSSPIPYTHHWILGESAALMSTPTDVYPGLLVKVQ